VKPEMTPFSLPISELEVTRVVLIIFESVATQFSSTILVLAANLFSLLKCGVSNESVLTTKMWCRQ
jgi:hypothetical protein